jgi:stage II sporulation protein D
MSTDRKISKVSSFIKLAARIGTGLCLMVIVWSCARVPTLKEETAGTFIRVPFVRVLLQENSDQATFSTDGAFAIECLTGGEQTVYYSTQPVRVKCQGWKLVVENQQGNIIHNWADEVNIIPRGRGNWVSFDGKKYRGIIKLLPLRDILQVINIVYMEDYLRGVVPPEIGKRTEDEIEAVKAQAVAARTYAMAHLQQYEGEPYDMKSSIIDQIYEGVDVEKPLVNRAIDATTGYVAMYHDELINAYYHSTCGGMTDNISHVWDRKEIPYLKAVEDDSACAWSKYFRWREVFTERQLRGRIEQYLASDRGRDLRIGKIRDIKIMERTPGGRVARLQVYTDTDVYRFYKDRIRWVIGRTSNPDLILPSDRFDVIIDRDQMGNIETVTFRGSGYGHGVGMCQCGAIGLSREGWTFERILQHYYTGVEVKKLY